MVNTYFGQVGQRAIHACQPVDKEIDQLNFFGETCAGGFPLDLSCWGCFAYKGAISAFVYL